MRYGYVVLRANVSAYGFKNNDTLPELRYGDVPRSVRKLANAFVIPKEKDVIGFDTTCSRFFSRSTSRYFVAFFFQCPAHAVTDNFAFYVLDLTARPGGRFTFAHGDVWRQIEPPWRAGDGTPIVDPGKPGRLP